MNNTVKKVSIKSTKHNLFCFDDGAKVICNKNGVGGSATFYVVKDKLQSGRSKKFCRINGDKITCDIPQTDYNNPDIITATPNSTNLQAGNKICDSGGSLPKQKSRCSHGHLAG